MQSSLHIRPWQPTDVGQLASICNNKNIWLNVRDNFPHPYTVTNAIEWIQYTLAQKPIQNMAIVCNGQIAGSIGVVPKDDVYRKNIELGYFVGEAYWGMGVATLAVAQMLEYIKQTFDVIRVYAEVFEHNKASMRVLEKNGFCLEAIRTKAVVKNNIVMNDYVWVKFLDT